MRPTERYGTSEALLLERKPAPLTCPQRLGSSFETSAFLALLSVFLQAAMGALQAYPGGMHVGGGINASNAKSFLDAGASHVIVTSYVFKNGVVDKVDGSLTCMSASLFFW